MGALNLRDFPADLHRTLKVEAARKGLSLRDYTVKLIREGLKRERRSDN